LFPVLMAQLRKCVPRDVPMHAESIRCAVDPAHRAEFLAVLKARQKELTPSQLARLKKTTQPLEAKPT
jgi:hypothetical protein